MIELTNTYKKLFLAILYVVVITNVASGSGFDVANNDTIKDLQKELKLKAKKSYRNNKVYEAIKYYRDYLDITEGDIKSTFRLAELYFKDREYEQAKSYFDTVIESRSKKYPMSYYYKGLVSVNLENYDEGIEALSSFRKAFRGHRDPQDYRRRARLQIERAEWAKTKFDETANVTIKHIGNDVNQPHIEFNPILVNDQTMVYGSLRDDFAGGIYRKMHVAEKQGTDWTYSGPFDETINAGKVHTGNAVFSVNMKTIYFTRCEENWQGKTICSIYRSKKENGEWLEPEKLPYPVNDDNYTSTQPALGNNLRRGNEILYFVSDRPGGKGGLDIWYTEPDRYTGEFREPRSLGRDINSPEDECSPYYDTINRTLYFSSKGHLGYGGFDIYKSTGSRNRWSESSVLPKSINSPFDDTYFITKSGTNGYFTSNRDGALDMTNGSCCDDIFYFEFNECIKATVSGKVINSPSYDIYDELNERYGLNLEYPKGNEPVEGVPVFAYAVDSTGDEILVSQTKTATDGTYRLDLDMGKNYSIIIKNYGFFDKVLRQSTKDIDCRDTIDKGVTTVNALPEITVRINVYYDHDKSRLKPEAKKTIDSKFLPLFDLVPNAIIEIGSHTDSTGSDSYNIKLSQRRSESVVNYLKSKGISEDRLIAKGYGESQPIAPNSNPDGSDNPENRQLNRRTELKIVGEVSSFFIDE